MGGLTVRQSERAGLRRELAAGERERERGNRALALSLLLHKHIKLMTLDAASHSALYPS